MLDKQQVFRLLRLNADRQSTYRAIFEATGIDIEEQSQVNMRDVYQRLRDCNELPDEIAELIQKEKRDPSNTLTPAELCFFKNLLNLPLIINHASHNLAAIIDSKKLLSSEKTKKENISVRTHTSTVHGQQHCVFFSLTPEQRTEQVTFLNDADRLEISLRSFRDELPDLYDASFVAGHFHAFQLEQDKSPLRIKSAEGSTTVFTRYFEVCQPVPGLFQERVFSHHGTDMVVKQKMSIRRTFANGRHIKPYLALSLIEFIRFLEPELRRKILMKSSDVNFISTLFYEVFSPGYLEFLIPKHLDLTERLDAVVSRFHDDLNHAKIRDFIQYLIEKNYESLETALSSGKNYNNLYFDYKDFTDFTLLNLAVYHNDIRSVELILRLTDIDINHAYITCGECYNIFGNIHRTVLLDAILQDNLEMIKLFFTNLSDPSKDIIFRQQPNVRLYELMTCIFHQRNDILCFLIDAQRPHQKALDMLLVYAASFKNNAVLELLLSHGANPNVSLVIRIPINAPISLEPNDLSTTTALITAIKTVNIDAVLILLANHADPSFYIRESGFFYQYGKGESPLLVAIERLVTTEGDEALLQKIIEHLVTAGADSDYISGKGVSVFTLLYEKIKLNPKDQFIQSLLSLLESRSMLTLAVRTSLCANKDTNWVHHVYAMVTTYNGCGEKLLLLGEKDGCNDGEIQFSLPNGRIDYEVESNSKEAAVNIVGYVCAINLLELEHSHCKTEFSLDDAENRLEVHEFELVHQGRLNYSPYTRTGFNSARDVRIPPLRKIQFIKIKDVSILPVTINGITIPLCLYQDKMLPIYVAPAIASLNNCNEYNTLPVTSVIHRLFFQFNKMFIQAIIDDNEAELKSLLLVQKGMSIRLDEQKFLSESLSSKNYNITLFLLRSHFRFSKHALHHNIFGDDLDKYKLPETVMIFILEFHPDCLRDIPRYKLDLLVDYILRNQYENLRDMMIKTLPKQIDCIIKQALFHGELDLMERLLKPLASDERYKILSTVLIHGDIFSFNTAINYSTFMRGLGFLLDGYVIPYRCNYFIHKVCHFYEVLCENNIDDCILDALLVIIDSLISNNTIPVNYIGQIYGVYRRMKRKKYPERMISNYLNCIKRMVGIPLRVLSLGDDFMAVYLLLNQQSYDKNLQRALFYDGYILNFIPCKMILGDNYLHYAVKQNSIAVVSLLLQACFNSKELDINEVNNEGDSALDIAVKRGFKPIIDKLLLFGAKAKDQNSLSLEQPQPLRSTIVIVTESPMLSDNQAKTGDFDYAHCLVESLKRNANALHIFRDSMRHILKVIEESQFPPVIHLILNPPRTGCALSLKDVKLLKDKKVKIVITAVEFAKYWDDELKSTLLNYMQLSDQNIFLDECDKNDAIRYAQNTMPTLVDRLKEALVSNVPPTINPSNISSNKTASNIMCFGMIRKGKGFAHVVKLAKLIKSSFDVRIRQKQIYIVGSLCRDKIRRGGTAYDSALYDLLREMYPSHHDRLKDKSPQELKEYYDQYLKSESAMLPIRLFIEIEEDKLAELFSKCAYTFYPAYRGVTLRNSSIASSLAFGNIIYSHIGAITPSILKPGGLYHEAMVLFDDADYHGYANRVLEDIVYRECIQCSSDGRSQNDCNRFISKKLVETELSLKQVAAQHTQLYHSIISADCEISIGRVVASSGLFESVGTATAINVEAPYTLS